MQGKRGRVTEWMESAIRIADSLTFGNFGEAICSKDRFGYTVEELLEKKVLSIVRSRIREVSSKGGKTKFRHILEKY